MAATPNHITIQVDEEALREQLETIIQKALEEMSMRMRFAADALDKSKWLDEFHEFHQNELKEARKKGFEEGRASVEGGD